MLKLTQSQVARTFSIASRSFVLGSLVALVGCGDGVERNSVDVPDRGAMKPGGGEDAAGPKGKEKANAPDTKVMVPGGKKA